MNPEDFKQSPSGTLIPTIQGCMAFVPNPLPPPSLDLGSVARLLERATLALGQLSGVGRTLANPHLLIRPFSRVEAVASSKIEGTVTTTEELLILEAEADSSKATADTKEVRNYIRALERGLKAVDTVPVSKRIFKELHQELLTGVAPSRGARFVPGEFKTDQNWIGARLIQNAKFVPPPPAEALQCLSDLEQYIHSDSEIPLLVQLALIHYQFETIHPFPDGNGRVGRLLIPLILCEREAMSQPLLYLSSFFEKQYTKYIDLMYDVSKSGNWLAWIQFFLEGVEASATDAVKKATTLQNLNRVYYKKVQAARSSALLAKIVDMLFKIPAVTIPNVMRELGISYNSAKNNIQKLVDLKILMTTKTEHRPQWYFAPQIIQITFGDELKEQMSGQTKSDQSAEEKEGDEPKQLTLT